MQRRTALASLLSTLLLPGVGWSVPLPDVQATRTRIGAAWRGPQDQDPRFAGVLEADWEARQMRVAYQVPLPSRCHGITPLDDGGLMVVAARPGDWLLRCDGTGRIVRQISLARESSNARLNGHLIAAPHAKVLFTTETDMKTGQGRIGVRDRNTLVKLDEWPSHGLEPHQILLDHEGHLMVANGGIPRGPDDKKYDLHRMDSSLVRIHSQNGKKLGQWQLPDARLSLRHMAWADDVDTGPRLLGLAMQAEHEHAEQRAKAPILAVFDGQTLTIPTTQNDGTGHSGDIAAVCGGGFVLSSHQPGKVYLWHPSAAGQLREVVQFKQAYALSPWRPGNDELAGALVATAFGLVRWHPSQPPIFVGWPQPMALDNHWVWMNAA